MGMPKLPLKDRLATPALEGTSGVTEEAIRAWLVSALAKELSMEPGDIDVRTPFDRYGLDSLASVAMAGELEEWLGRELPVTSLYDYSTIEALSQHLARGSD